MQIDNYISNKRKFYDNLLEYLEGDNGSQGSLNYDFASLRKEKNQEEIKSFLYLLIQVAHNHHRTNNIINKIEHILLYFKKEIQIMSNLEIFNLFKSHKLILLFILQKNLITIDQQICESLSINASHSRFFKQEIKSFYEGKNTKSSSSDDIFNQKRKIGENDSYICKIIRQDSIDDFISHVNRSNIPLNMKIKRSTFETNSYLIMNDPTLIEYAAFHGSIQIFQYLRVNNAEMTPSLWIYAIHGENAEIIHLLEEYNVQPEDKTYEACLIEAIKCHHNNIARYIFDNLYTKSDIEYDGNLLGSIFHSYNYSFFPENIIQWDSFYYLCQYKYMTLVDLFLDEKKDEIESTIILKKTFSLLIGFQKQFIFKNGVLFIFINMVSNSLCIFFLMKLK